MIFVGRLVRSIVSDMIFLSYFLAFFIDSNYDYPIKSLINLNSIGFYMKKEGLPGMSILIVGLLVGGISFFFGTKFFFFQLIGIILFFYGLVKMFILRDKMPELVPQEEHRLKIATHRLKYPLNSKHCPSCNSVIPTKAHLCIHCGTEF